MAAAEQKDCGHRPATRTAGGPSDGRRHSPMAGQESWEFTPKKVVTYSCGGTLSRRHQGGAGSTAHSGTAVATMPPKPMWMT